MRLLPLNSTLLLHQPLIATLTAPQCIHQIHITDLVLLMIDTTGTEIETETGMPSEVDIRTGGQDGERGAKERRGEERS
jgi:hypothetical protein